MVMSIPYYISLGTGDSDLSPVLLIIGPKYTKM